MRSSYYLLLKTALCQSNILVEVRISVRTSIIRPKPASSILSSVLPDIYFLTTLELYIWLNHIYLILLPISHSRLFPFAATPKRRIARRITLPRLTVRWQRVLRVFSRSTTSFSTPRVTRTSRSSRRVPFVNLSGDISGMFAKRVSEPSPTTTYHCFGKW